MAIRETHQPDIDGWIPGDYWLQCDECGLDFRRSSMRQRWDKAWVCEKDWEPENPQDFVRGIKEMIAVPVARPEGQEGNLITSWTNDTYETFTASDGDASWITSAIDTSGGGSAVTNNTGITAGTEYNITAIVDWTSGQYPSLTTGSASGADGTLLGQLSETDGVNNINFTAVSGKTYIYVTNTTDASWGLNITLTKIVKQGDL